MSLQPPRKLVLIAPFASLQDIAKRRFWFYPTSLLVDNAFNNSELLREFKGPVTIIHGDQDAVISQKSGINVQIPSGFWSYERVEKYLRLAQTHDAKFILFQLTAPKDVLLERLAQRPTAADATSSVPIERILKNLDYWEQNQYDEGMTISTEDKTPEEIASIIIHELQKVGIV